MGRARAFATELVTPAAVLAGKARWCIVRGNALATLAALPDGCAQAVICDPPYSSGGTFSRERQGAPADKYISAGARKLPDFAGDNRDQRSYVAWCALWLAEALRIATPGAPLVQFTDWRQLPATTDAVQAGGWMWRGVVVWDKVAARPQMGRFTAQSEFAVYATNGAALNLASVGCLPGVFRHMPERFKEHIAQKPLTLMQDLVKICEPGGIVLDPFCGSGSTGVAALREGRRFIGIELLDAWAERAAERLRAEEVRSMPRPGLARARPRVAVAGAKKRAR